MNEKKISFGFAKINKKPPLLVGPAASVSLKSKDDSIQMIDCLEGQTIKVLGKTEEPPAPLVIPLRAQDKITVSDRLAKLISIKQDKQQRLRGEQTSTPKGNAATSSIEVKTEPPEDGTAPHVPLATEETLEQRAAREIVEDMHKAVVKKEEENNIVIPLLPEELPLDGATESTMADYESVSIEHFGLALLRGMGWKDDPKKAKEEGPSVGPVPRPKGLGLGADRAMKTKAANAPLIPPAQGEVLVMKCGAQVKVLAGKHSKAYGTKGAPDEVMFIDWQVARYGSPVLDLVYYIFCCSDEEFRRRHYDEMMSIYYNSLATLLEKLGHNPQEVFPRTALMRQLRQFGRFGLTLAVFIVPMMCTRDEDIPDLEATAEKFLEEQNEDLAVFTKNANQDAYRKRMSAVIRDTVRYGYI